MAREIEVNGQTVTVGEEFFSLPREKQDAVVNQIARSLAASTPQPAPAPAPSEGAARVGGLAGRALVEGAIEGIGGIPALGADVLYNVGQFARQRMPGVDYLARAAGVTSEPEYGLPVSRKLGEAAAGAAGALGLPEAQTEGERLAMATGKGAISALTPAGLARVGAKYGPQAITKGAEFLAAKPVTQTAAGAAAGGATEYALQSGVDPRLAAAIGIGTGMGAIPAVGTVGRAVQSAAAPFTRGGQEYIVGSTLRQFASDPELAIQQARAAQQLVPGSYPTLPEAARDPGLLALQAATATRSPEGMPILARGGEQMAARQQAMEQAAGMTPGQAEQAVSALRARQDVEIPAMFPEGQQVQVVRNQAPEVASQQQLIEQVFGPTPSAAPKMPTLDLRPIENKITDIAGSREGARTPVKSFLGFATRELEGVTDLGTLFSKRQNLADVLSGKFSGTTPEGVDLSNIKLAYSEGKKVLNAIDDQIETLRPGYKAKMKEYGAEREKIGRAETMEEIRRKAEVGEVMPQVDVRPLSANQFRRQLEANADVIARLDPSQQKILTDVMADLERSAAVRAGNVKAPGSDTFRNMSVAAALGNVIGGGATENTTLRALTKPLMIASRMQEDEITRVLIDAILDPKVGAALMQKATPKNMETVGEFFRNGAVRNFLATEPRAAGEVMQEERRPNEITVRPRRQQQ